MCTIIRMLKIKKYSQLFMNRVLRSLPRVKSQTGLAQHSLHSQTVLLKDNLSNQFGKPAVT